GFIRPEVARSNRAAATFQPKSRPLIWAAFYISEVSPYVHSLCRQSFESQACLPLPTSGKSKAVEAADRSVLPTADCRRYESGGHRSDSRSPQAIRARALD